MNNLLVAKKNDSSWLLLVAEDNKQLNEVANQACADEQRRLTGVNLAYDTAECEIPFADSFLSVGLDGVFEVSHNDGSNNLTFAGNVQVLRMANVDVAGGQNWLELV